MQWCNELIKNAVIIWKKLLPNNLNLFQEMSAEFLKLMKSTGLTHGEIQIIQGDLTEQKFQSKILEADVIYVNNKIFGPSLNNQLEGNILDFFWCNHWLDQKY